jgi:hypothetical protein
MHLTYQFLPDNFTLLIILIQFQIPVIFPSSKIGKGVGAVVVVQYIPD